jgi:hypothetical protein
MRFGVWLGLIKGGLCWIVAILIRKDEKKIEKLFEWRKCSDRKMWNLKGIIRLDWLLNRDNVLGL